MKLIMSTILLLTVATLINAKPLSANDSIADQIPIDFQSITKAWKEAYNSKDSISLEQFYTKNARYISSHVKGLELEGREKVIANFKNGMNLGGYIDTIEILDINTSGDLATLFCKYQATNNGSTVIGRNLLVMKKIEGKWLINIHMTVI